MKSASFCMMVAFVVGVWAGRVTTVVLPVPPIGAAIIESDVPEACATMADVEQAVDPVLRGIDALERRIDEEIGRCVSLNDAKWALVLDRASEGASRRGLVPADYIPLSGILMTED